MKPENEKKCPIHNSTGCFCDPRPGFFDGELGREPAYPVTEKSELGETRVAYQGLTKREIFAKDMAQGVLSGLGEPIANRDVSDWLKSQLPKLTIEIADAMLAELERTK